jgi:tetratricopeptide (TPR) repeat protein
MRLMPLFGLATTVAAMASAAAPAAGQAGAVGQTPYVEAVVRYGPGSEREAVEALGALKLRSVDRVLEALDRACVEHGAKSCLPADLERAAPDVRPRVAAVWRQLYPRAMALHTEALVAAGSTRDAAGVALHVTLLLRLASRCEDIARVPDAPPAMARLAVIGPRLVLWALQYLRDETTLARVLSLLDRARSNDSDTWLARGALAELRVRPEAIAAAERQAVAALQRKGGTPEGMTGERQPTDARRVRDVERPDSETERRLDAAARVYRQAVAAHPDLPELRLRLGRILALLDRLDEAERQLGLAMALQPDGRQAYLAALFVADLRERQERPKDAMAAYAAARQAWPGAQAPVVALARLRVLSGEADAARALLADVHAERDMRERSDPWLGYVGGQGWRLAGALAELQRGFEAVP